MHGHKNKIRLLFWGFVVVAAALLNGCSSTMTMGRKDGPPPYDVDASNIPDAVPKKEALAKYGNMPKYRVNGKNYYVMKNARNYEERGIASWYGNKFHAQRTSSGERYNMLAMTAAHRSLPLPTYVEVTNLKNGNKVIVKVNDRGPFASNRLIDLSYVAAKKLGMMGHGTAQVNVRAIDPEEAFLHKHLLAFQRTKIQKLASNSSELNITKPAATSTSRPGIYVQVGAFKQRKLAENLKKRLSPIVKPPVALAHSKKLYRVKIGPVKDVSTADGIKKKLRKIGLASTHVRV